MSFSSRQLANGYYVAEVEWLKQRTVIIRMTLTDPDGDVDEHVVTWAPPANTELREALSMLAVHINEMPHIRAIALDLEFSIGPADPHYTLAVEMEMVN